MFVLDDNFDSLLNLSFYTGIVICHRFTQIIRIRCQDISYFYEKLIK